MIYTFESETGYIRNKSTKAVYTAHVIYLGKYDTAENYEEATEADYDAYIASKNLETEARNNARRIKHK